MIAVGQLLDVLRNKEVNIIMTARRCTHCRLHAIIYKVQDNSGVYEQHQKGEGADVLCGNSIIFGVIGA